MSRELCSHESKQFTCTWKLNLQFIFHWEDLPTLLAEEQRKFEVARTVQRWCWGDESCEQSATDIMLRVASAFGGMCDSY